MFQKDTPFIIRSLRITVYTVIRKLLMMKGVSFETYRVQILE